MNFESCVNDFFHESYKFQEAATKNTEIGFDFGGVYFRDVLLSFWVLIKKPRVRMILRLEVILVNQTHLG